ncbi:hypothetical protein TIFTF001_006108 [Ficus carica]|uniref:Uncharacterized protein n=1 Tax=Ficus carica TaxID=3494 RepID=A0AA88A9R1_FICCA|nr:hypothetical protein TIFTF001_006108 [Ficus carica]
MVRKKPNLDGVPMSTTTNNQICRNPTIYAGSVKPDLPATPFPLHHHSGN